MHSIVPQHIPLTATVQKWKEGYRLYSAVLSIAHLYRESSISISIELSDILITTQLKNFPNNALHFVMRYAYGSRAPISKYAYLRMRILNFDRLGHSTASCVFSHVGCVWPLSLQLDTVH